MTTDPADSDRDFESAAREANQRYHEDLVAELRQIMTSTGALPGLRVPGVVDEMSDTLKKELLVQLIYNFGMADWAAEILESYSE